MVRAEPRTPPRYRNSLLFATSAAAENDTKIIAAPAIGITESSASLPTGVVLITRHASYQ
jgi:hypothetical protein